MSNKHKFSKENKTSKKIEVKKPKCMAEVKPEVKFYLVSGEVISSLYHLANTLETMTEEVFRHHVNEAKNDFANWIKEVIGEAELAEKLFSSKSLKDHQLLILSHIVKDLKKHIG